LRTSTAHAWSFASDRPKGHKDRDVMLSPRLLIILRQYWKIQRPKPHLFPGVKPDQPISPRTVQRVCQRALAASGLSKRFSMHALRQVPSQMTGEGLEPSTNGLTYLIGFHRPPRSRTRPHGQIREQSVDGLDYLFAIAGVPRLVSEAGAGDPPVPCLLITQSPSFSDRHASRCQPRCGEGALRAFQHTAAFTRRGSVSSRARLRCNTPCGA